jgi:Zn-dependent protease
LNGLAIVSIAGPLSNVVMAGIMGGIAILTLKSFLGFAQFMAEGVQLSLYLALFNMLPIPPLDGSKLLLAARVPIRVYVELARFGLMLLIVIMSSTGVGRWMSEWSVAGARAIFVMWGWR